MVDWNNIQEKRAYNREYMQKYRQKESYKLYHKKYNAQYRKTESEKTRRKQWRDKHKDYHKLKTAQFKAEKRGLGFNQILPNIYEGTEIKVSWHHINDKDVIAVPYTVHDKYAKNHREILNAYVEILYGINLKEM